MASTHALYDFLSVKVTKDIKDPVLKYEAFCNSKYMPYQKALVPKYHDAVKIHCLK